MLYPLKLANLGNKTKDEMVALVADLAPDINALLLSGNELGSKTGAELVALVRAIPATVIHLDLGYNALYSRTGAELAALVAAIPASVSSLHLSRNSLGVKAGIELRAIMASLPASISSLDLSGNLLHHKTYPELKALLAAIPKSVTSLGLGGNLLSTKPAVVLVALAKAIPASVRSLDLSANSFDNKKADELALIFAALPSSLISLDLSANNLSTEQVDVIINALPASVETLILDEMTINLTEYYALQLLNQVAKLSAKNGVERLAFDTIKPPIEINQSYLNRFIDFLEKQNTPTASLTCGLLLEGQIETTSILEDCSKYDQYREKRIHDAISFYTKAAVDPSIKPMVEFLLRNLKTHCPIQSIQIRLALYDLAPEDNFNCEFNQASKNRLGLVTPLLASFGVFNLASAQPDSVKVTTTFEL